MKFIPFFIISFVVILIITVFRNKRNNYFKITERRIKVYKKFLQLLIKNNTTAYEVSKKTGIANSTLCDWKNGRSKPKADKLKILADYFGVDVGFFLEEQVDTKH